MRAIELYIQYEKSAADVIRELGYPDRKTLRVWLLALFQNGSELPTLSVQELPGMMS
jgi:transposase-like protein